MALYTSVQSGPFDVASTWDLNAVPGDADQFNISYGHAVAVSGDIRPSGGFDNSNIYGKLHIQGSGCYLRMNGNLIVRNDNNYGQFFVEGENSGGFFRMDPGSTLEIRGSVTEEHKLYVYRNNHRYVKMEIEGDNPGPETTLSADADNNTTTLSFTDASKFRAGDWINVYVVSRDGRDYNYYRSDEAFWIHDINGNTVYFRHFVSPSATITAFSGNKIVVDDADVFRINQKIIFGTEANRNVCTITAIASGSNTITLDASVAGSVVGEKVYRTGIEKQHFSGDDVIRMAAVLTADSNSGSNTITVNNTNGFKVGDIINIPNNNPDYDDHAGTWNQVQDFTITNINTTTNVITFTAGYTDTNQTTLPYSVKAGLGGIVANLTRNTKIKAPDGATGQCSFIYSNNAGNTNDYYTALKIKNTEIILGPNNRNASYSAISLMGAFGHSTNSYTGVVFDFSGNVISAAHEDFGYYAIYLYANHYRHYRNNTFYNCRSWAVYQNDYNMQNSFFGNLFSRCGGGMDSRGHREYYEEHHYNYMIKVGNGRFIYNGYATPKNIYGEYYIFSTGRPFYADRTVRYLNIKKCYYDYYKFRGNTYYGDNIVTNNCWIGNAWDVTMDNGSNSKYLSDTIEISRVSYSDYYRNFDQNYITHLDANFKSDYTVITNNSALRYWDEIEKAWRVYVDKENSRNGFTNLIYVPDNSKVFIRASIKSHSSLTNYPQLFIQGLASMTRGFPYRKVIGSELNSQSASDVAEITECTGFRDWIDFSSASKTNYETKSIIVPAFPFSYWLAIGILINNGSSGNAFRGWWEKDLIINVEKPNTSHVHVDTLDSKMRRKKQVASTYEPRKIIWGGG